MGEKNDYWWVWYLAYGNVINLRLKIGRKNYTYLNQPFYLFFLFTITFGKIDICHRKINT